jgi:hypothetical protein
MTDDRSTGRPDTGSGGETFTIRPATTAEEVLALLKRQGISDLEALVKAALAKVHKETEEDDAPQLDVDFCVFDHYVLFRESEPPA